MECQNKPGNKELTAAPETRFARGNRMLRARTRHPTQQEICRRLDEYGPYRPQYSAVDSRSQNVCHNRHPPDPYRKYSPLETTTASVNENQSLLTKP
jgi:hypothetical protein